jgi:endonuclease/exonuclease/phosphatase (EEP) superfamily protein YafD
MLVRPVLRLGVAAVAWPVVGILAVVAGIRLFVYDQNQLAVMLVAMTLWLFLPLYPILVVALLLRQRILAVACAVLVVLHVVWVWPLFQGASTKPAWADEGTRVRIFSANVRSGNTHMDGIVGEIADADADLVVLQEFTSPWELALRDAGLWDAYPYQVVERPTPVAGAVILSRFPVLDVAVEHMGTGIMLRADVRIGGRAVSVFDVHPRSPVTSFRNWSDYASAATGVLRGARGARIAAGDFNATPFNRWMHTLADLGYRDAHSEVGRALATTWPNGTEPVPPVRIDHILLAGPVAVRTIREGRGEGSDHKPLISDLLVRPQASP